MKIEKQKLLNALEAVKPGLATKDNIEQATSFVFQGGKVVTYNDEVSISHPLDIGFEGAVDAVSFYSILSKIKEDKKGKLSVAKKKQQIIITSGSQKSGLICQEEIKIPLGEIDKASKWKTLPDNFVSAVKFAMFSVSKDMSKPVLTCIGVRKDKVHSTDDYRITEHLLDGKVKKDFLLPFVAAQTLIRYPVVEYCVRKSWCHFRTEEETVLSFRTYSDNFPDVSKFLKVKGEKTKLPEDINNIIDKAYVFARRDIAIDEQVQINIEGKTITVSGEGQTGWFKQTKKIKEQKRPIFININPDFLKQITEETKICWVDNKKSIIKFKSKNWTHVISMRVTE